MAKFRKKPVNGQEFKVVDPCCNGSLDFEGRTYKRLAGSKVANNVMEEETFENEEIAQLMNETFINIKVDREEHPEVDSIYMEFAQAIMSTAGGWPLNVVLTPDLKPFFAVTYIPLKSNKGLIGMDQFVMKMQMLWILFMLPSERNLKLNRPASISVWGRC